MGEELFQKKKRKKKPQARVHSCYFLISAFILAAPLLAENSEVAIEGRYIVVFLTNVSDDTGKHAASQKSQVLFSSFYYLRPINLLLFLFLPFHLKVFFAEKPQKLMYIQN